MTTATLERVYEPRGTARTLFGVRSPEVLLSGPAGTGKSRAALEKIHHMCLVNPGMRALIIRKTFTSLKSTAIVTYEQHVAQTALASGVVTKRVEAPQYRYSNGSTITLGGMDNATRIMSSEYDVAYVQEAIELTEDDWEAITTRLRNGVVSFQQIIADTNPSYPTHWLKRRCERGQTIILESRHEDNPVLFDSDGRLTEPGQAYMSKLDNLTGVRYNRLRLGQWVGAEGLIYEDWDEAVHLIEPFEVPSSWSRYWSVDFGFTNPFVLQCWAEDHDGRLYLYRELYRTQRLVTDHARDILNLVTNSDGNWTEPRPDAIICDHDAEDRATLRRALNMGDVAATKTVTDGIQAVQQRLRKAGDGKARLYIFKGARVSEDKALVQAKKPTCTAEELPGYVWDVKEGKAPKESPVKDSDHGMDALRYVVAHLDLRNEPRVRFL